MSARIAIVAHGAFHVLDLARELHDLGHHVVFYSVLPKARIEKNSFPLDCYRSLLPFLWPIVALARRGPQPVQARFDATFQFVFDRLVAAVLEPCDVLIGMSGMSVASLEAGRRKFAAKIFLERGSRHILSQKQILEDIPGGRAQPVPRFLIKREVWAYAFADVIVVPSRQVEQSFLDQGTPCAKLFRNPYGVDLDMFPPTAAPAGKEPTVIYVGTWSLRKGCDVLWEACKRSSSWNLLHVGPIGDAPVPQSPRFEHHEPVHRAALANFYRAAHVFVLASREEGLSLVQAQALACGLPIVCTDRTGGEDFREILSDPRWIKVVPSGDVEALRRCVETALSEAVPATGMRCLPESVREHFSWKAYGKRYSEEITRRLSAASG